MTGAKLKEFYFIPNSQNNFQSTFSILIWQPPFFLLNIDWKLVGELGKKRYFILFCTVKTTKLVKVVCWIVFDLSVDYKCFSVPYTRIKNKEMSDYYFRYTQFGWVFYEPPLMKTEVFFQIYPTCECVINVKSIDLSTNFSIFQICKIDQIFNTCQISQICCVCHICQICQIFQIFHMYQIIYIS